MLKNVNLKKKLSREEYKRLLPDWQQRVFGLEKACWDHRVPTMVVVEGWDGAGKGAAIAALTQRMDPRGFKLYPITGPSPEELSRPWLWRFWLKVPDQGDLVIFNHSWYYRVLDARVDRETDEVEWRQGYRDIIEFERTLADSGVVIIKLFLHISKKDQKKRLRAVERDPLESWRVTPADWDRHRRYDDYLVAIEDMLELTESEHAPWTIVEATSRWHARKKVFETIIAALESRLGTLAPSFEAAHARAERESDLRVVSELLEEGKLEQDDDLTGDED